MAYGKKTGGRQKGGLNKKTLDLMKICEEEGIEPFREMVRQCRLIDDAVERFTALEKICQYLFPKKRAVEVTGEDGEELGIKISIVDYQGKK
jgi:hypothetical protein